MAARFWVAWSGLLRSSLAIPVPSFVSGSCTHVMISSRAALRSTSDARSRLPVVRVSVQQSAIAALYAWSATLR